MSKLLDAQMSPLAMAALALIDEEPRHPYDVYQVMMHRREDILVKIRPGSLYHAVGKLAENNYIEEIGTDREGNRPERTTYRITRAGGVVLRSTIADRLANPRKEYPIFPLAVAEAHHLAKEDVLQHLSHRRSVLARDLTEVEDIYRHVIDDRGKPARYVLDIDLIIHQIRAEIAWVDTTIAALQDGRLEWTAS